MYDTVSVLHLHKFRPYISIDLFWLTETWQCQDDYVSFIQINTYIPRDTVGGAGVKTLP